MNGIDILYRFRHFETSGEMKIGLYYHPIASQVNADRQKRLEVESPKILSPITDPSSGDPAQ